MGTTRYETWGSPLSAQELAVAGVRLGEPRYDGDDLYWTEGRPAEQGRVALMRERAGTVAEAAPGLSVRTRVHEYGGGAWAARDGVVVVSSDPSGQLLRVDGPEPVALSPAQRGWRFADLRVLPRLGLVLAVREDHSAPGEPVNTLVALRLTGPNDDGGTVLAAGADFYACPELSEGGHLAWMQWRHPAMPWDSCLIVTGRLDPQRLTVADSVVVAGGPRESAVHPLWRGEDLLFCSDRSGFSELYVRPSGGDMVQLTRLNADLTEPFWVFGRRPLALTGNGDVVIRPRIDGRSRPMLLHGTGGGGCGFGAHSHARECLPLTAEIVDCDSLDASGDRIVLLAELEDVPTQIVELAPGRRRVVRSAAPRVLHPEWVSHAEAVSWPGQAGEVHGWFYAPTRPLSVEPSPPPVEPPPPLVELVETPPHEPPPVEPSSVETPPHEPSPALPPLIVVSHGGPTAFSSSGFDLGVQFWTTRGFAVLDVNYSGSSGYGRDYVERLRGQWGVLDVSDCVAGALFLAETGRVDGSRLAIRGGSAGGYTTLRALTTSDAFAAGCSRYGIGDLAALAVDTHKFESRYLDGLLGPWPESSALYAERSPINHVDALSCPMLILQGADDKVVPPNQAETMARAVAAKGLEVELIVFEGEGHGFRRADTIERALEAELAFYERVLMG
ncbi:prolyl oligopeptidase family serine peptidase [Micropruina sp.]|uniref:S9 family peptidase n=1 Tax=Micropruina sp. TaxID=2737536 RepID=UPI0039E5894C